MITEEDLQTSARGEWGTWEQDRYYKLDVVQQPIRARMCGFGDKDRRPLAPAAVVKMVVKERDNTIIDVDTDSSIDFDFFVVTVDLWDERGVEPRNLVLHPSAGGHASGSQNRKRRMRAESALKAQQERQSPPPLGFGGRPGPDAAFPTYSYIHPPPAPSAVHTSSPASYPPYDQGPGVPTSGTQPASQQGPSEYWQGVYPPNSWESHPHASNGGRVGGSGRRSGSAAAPEFSAVRARQQSLRDWSLANPPKSIGHPSGMDNSRRDSPESSSMGSTGQLTARSMDGYVDQTVYTQSPSSQRQGLETRRQQEHVEQLEAREVTASTSAYASTYSQNRIATSPPRPQEQDQQTWNASPSPPTNYLPRVFPEQVPYITPIYPPAILPPQPSPTPSSSPPPTTIDPHVPSLPQFPTPDMNPRLQHNYTRCLVGPVTAAASKLADEKGDVGIFFLLQDLSIRTEGTFRLRLRLMNVGAPPAPGNGATHVHSAISPVLAQCFTEAFTVYSAKRFPGVPEMTHMSQVFANQGQKLPLRNRSGSQKSKKGRKGGDSDSATEPEDGEGDSDDGVNQSSSSREH